MRLVLTRVLFRSQEEEMWYMDVDQQGTLVVMRNVDVETRILRSNRNNTMAPDVLAAYAAKTSAALALSLEGRYSCLLQGRMSIKALYQYW